MSLQAILDFITRHREGLRAGRVEMNLLDKGVIFHSFDLPYPFEKVVKYNCFEVPEPLLTAIKDDYMMLANLDPQNPLDVQDLYYAPEKYGVGILEEHVLAQLRGRKLDLLIS